MGDVSVRMTLPIDMKKLETGVVSLDVRQRGKTAGYEPEGGARHGHVLPKRPHDTVGARSVSEDGRRACMRVNSAARGSRKWGPLYRR